MNQTPKHGRLFSLFRESVFLTLFSKLITYLKHAASHCVIGHLLSSYRADQNQTENSLTYRLLNNRRFRVKSKLLIPAKRFCNRIIQESRLLAMGRRVMRYLFDLPVSFYGIILFSFGIYTAILNLILKYGFSFSEFSSSDTLTSLAISIIAAPLLFGKNPLSETLGNSTLARFLLCSVLGYRPQSLCAESKPKLRLGIALILGIFLGLLTLKASILSVLLMVGLCISLYLILVTPEIGTILIFALVPFLSTMQLASLIIYTVAAFCIKLLQGKRSLSFELTDYAVLGFLIFLLVSGIFSLAPSASLPPALLMVCMMGAYFLVVSSVRTMAAVKRCVGVFLFSVGAEALLCIWEAAFQPLSTQWQDLSLFPNLGGRIVGTLGNPNVLGEYFILTIPFLFAVFGLSKKTSEKIGILVLIGISGTALIFTWSRGAWLGLLIGIVVYSIITCRNALPTLLLGGTVCPLVLLLLPSTVWDRIVSITNLADTSIAYRLNIWRGCFSMVRDHFFGGIGTGINAFQAVYPNYALSGIEAAPHSHSLYLEILLEHGIFGFILFFLVVFLFLQSCTTYLRSKTEPQERPMRMFTAAGLCSILAFLLQGATDYVWYNYRIFAFFWILLALISVCRRCGTKERTSHTAEYAYYGN